MSEPDDFSEDSEAAADADESAAADARPESAGVLAYRTPPALPPRLVTVRRLPGTEAEMARAKLESEGIRCFIADSNLSATHPLLFTDARLQVSEEDATRAAQILDSPPADARADEYVDEDYRCPRCHRKAVDLLPLSGAWRQARVGCLALLVVPVLLTLVGWTFPHPRVHAFMDRLTSAAGVPWFGLVLVLSVAVMLAKRRKRCRECGHEWGNPEERA